MVQFHAMVYLKQLAVVNLHQQLYDFSNTKFTFQKTQEFETWNSLCLLNCVLELVSKSACTLCTVQHTRRHNPKSITIKRDQPAQVALVDSESPCLSNEHGSTETCSVDTQPLFICRTGKEIEVTFIYSLICTISENDNVQCPPKSWESLPLNSMNLGFV